MPRTQSASYLCCMTNIRTPMKHKAAKINRMAIGNLETENEKQTNTGCSNRNAIFIIRMNKNIRNHRCGFSYLQSTTILHTRFVVFKPQSTTTTLSAWKSWTLEIDLTSETDTFFQQKTCIRQYSLIANSLVLSYRSSIEWRYRLK